MSSNWVLKQLLHPASNYIAQFSFYANNLPSPGLEQHVAGDSLQGVHKIQNPSSEAKHQRVNVTDLEQTLKHKTFTRAEIEHLTHLLQSTTVDAFQQDGKERSGPITSSHLTAAELAKAYMRTRTPRLRCTSALYGAARSPYSRVQLSTTHKKCVNEEASSLKETTWVQSHDIGSVGPIRRVRQKTNLMFPSKSPVNSLFTPIPPVGSDAASSGNQVSKRRSSIFDKDIGFVSCMRRMRQKTNRMSPVISLSLRSPGRDATTQKQVMVDENGANKNSGLRDKVGAEGNGVITTVSSKDAMPSVKATDSVFSSFEMVVLKDSLDSISDEHSFSSWVGSTSATTTKGEFDTCREESKALVIETVNLEKELVFSSDINPPVGVLLEKPSIMGASNTGPTAEQDLDFTLPVTHAPVTSPQPAKHSLFDQAISPDKPTSACVFSFDAKSGDKATTFTVSSTSIGESSIPKIGAQSETLSSNVTAAAEKTTSVVQSDQERKGESQKAEDILRKAEHAAPSAISASTIPLFAIGVSNSTSRMRNVSAAFTSSLLSVPGVSPVSKLNSKDTSAPGSLSICPLGEGSGSSTFGASASSSAKPSSSDNNQFQSSNAGDIFRKPEHAASSAISVSTTPLTSLGSCNSNSMLKHASIASTSSLLTVPAVSPISTPLLLETSGSASSKLNNTSPSARLNISPLGATTAAVECSSSKTIIIGASAPSSEKPSSSDNTQLQSSNKSAVISLGFSVQAGPRIVATPFKHSSPMQLKVSSSSPSRAKPSSYDNMFQNSKTSTSSLEFPGAAGAPLRQSKPMQFRGSSSRASTPPCAKLYSSDNNQFHDHPTNSRPSNVYRPRLKRNRGQGIEIVSLS